MEVCRADSGEGESRWEMEIHGFCGCTLNGLKFFESISKLFLGGEKNVLFKETTKMLSADARY